MPLPSFYHSIPHSADNHYGKEVYTRKAFMPRSQTAMYPIFALLGAAVTVATLSAIKNTFGNNNVTISRSKAGAWNSHELNAVDIAGIFNERPAAQSVLPPAEQ